MGIKYQGQNQTMPKNRGTSRKGKPKKEDRAAGMGRALERATQHRFRPKSNGSSRGAGMVASGASSIGIEEDVKQTTSVLEVDELTDFLTQAELAQKDFAIEKEQFVILDSAGSEYKDVNETRAGGGQRVKWADQQNTLQSTDEIKVLELSVPRRPKWDYDMDGEDLDRLEKESFLQWRRNIAKQEEELFTSYRNSCDPIYKRKTVTPFEKNLDVWRQLWRVLDRSQVVIQIVDARNPLFYLSSDLRSYVEQELQKPMIILVNKSDFLTVKQRKIWHKYFNEIGVFHLFFSAYIEQEKIDEAMRCQEQEREVKAVDNFDLYDKGDSIISESSAEEGDDYVDYYLEENKSLKMDDSDDARRGLHDNNFCDDRCLDDPNTIISSSSRVEDSHGVITLLNREELLQALQDFAVSKNIFPVERNGHIPRSQFGFCGFPNVGKSSVINVLVAASKYRHNSVRVAVAAQPGKTKHFQTLLLPDRDDMILCDCPGLVFPSFVSSTADLIAAGVYPIAQMRDYWQVIELICQRIPRQVLNAHYSITLPQPSYQDLKEQSIDRDGKRANKIRIPPPTSEDLLGTYCIARSIFASSSGVPDYQRAARVIIKDFTNGKLIYCHPPPSVNSLEEFHLETLSTAFRASKRLRERVTTSTDEPAFKSPSEDVGLSDSFDPSHGCNTLDSVYGIASVDDHPNANQSLTHLTTTKKSSKKNRKGRDDDPYGCHKSNLNEFRDLNIACTSSNSSPAIGVYVNAGKKLGNIPFTRSQPRGVRAVVAATNN